MNKLIDLSGNKYGRLTVIEFSCFRKNKPFWLCRCDCGNKVIICGNRMKTGQTKSCGCLARENLITRETTHGMSRTKEYRTWSHMKERCQNDRCKNYKDYGGRGITVCDEWSNSFEQFYKDMGSRPKKKSIDRIDVNGNYEPDNCRWATMKTQQNNRTNNHMLTCFGKTQNLMRWSEEVNIKYKILHCRINKHKWSIERALTTKVRHY